MPGMVLEIAGIPVRVRSTPDLLDSLSHNYATYVAAAPPANAFHLDVRVAPGQLSPFHEVQADWRPGRWHFERIDFDFEWRPDSRSGAAAVATCAKAPMDCVLRLLHSVLAASQGGFLLHAASAIRNRRAFIFSGVSGAGKTTISRLAPPDVTLLTDEISYIRPLEGRYHAFGTPFAGELGVHGANTGVPLEAVYLLAKGQENKIEPVSQKVAAATLLRNILFFVKDPGLVQRIFETTCDFLSKVPVFQLSFVPTPKVWEMIA